MPPTGSPETTPAPSLPPSSDDLFNPGGGAGAKPPEANLTPTPSGLPRAGLPTPAAELPVIEAPALGSGASPSTAPEVLLEGELPQAPPLGAPGSDNAPVSENLLPIPNDVPNEAPPVQAANPPKRERGGFLANILGRTRKR